jgi:hypothetical protein
MNRHTRRHKNHPAVAAPADTMCLTPANRFTPAFACAAVSGFALFSLILLRGLL